MTALIPISLYFDPKSNQIIQIPSKSPENGQILYAGQYQTYEYLERHGFGTLTPKLKVKRLSEDAILPTRSNPTDAGLDLYAAEDVEIGSRFSGHDKMDLTYKPGDDPSRRKVSTDIGVEVPPGLGLFIWDRSGLSARDGLHRVAGVVDSSYRGPVKVALVNLSNKSYSIKKGDRIAQAILAPLTLAEVVEVSELAPSNRGSGGFGSTGR
jgi:dUTP pyrophosphatase